MDIYHHVSFNSTSQEALLAAIQNLGIRYKVSELPPGGGQIVYFDIFESDPNWSLVFELLKIYQGLDIYRGGDFYETVFSDEEIRKAEWVRLIPTFEQGYPEPENSWPFKKQFTYEKICPECAIHQQYAAYRIKKEPRLGKNAFYSLVGIGDIFCISEVFQWLETVNAKGYVKKETVIHRSNQPSEKIHQLYVTEIAHPGLLDVDAMRQVTCRVCGRIKYYYHRKGFMRLRKDTLLQNVDFQKTAEWFGVGLVAYQDILISNKIANLILDRKWQGVKMKVVEIV